VWPETNFRDAFVMWREIGVDYEGGVLDLPARAAIHLAHRIGALTVLVVLGVLAIRLLRSPVLRQDGAVLGALLAAQIALGIQNVLLFLPLANAVAHNGMAALLLAMVAWLTWRSAPAPLADLTR